MQLGPLKVQSELIVAGIADDVLLGADIIQNGSQGPADLILSEECMVLNGASIRLLLFGIPDQARKAYAADHYVVPPMSEMVLDVYVDRNDTDDADEAVRVEPAPQVFDVLRLVMANSLVNVADNTTVKVRVLNPYHDVVSIKQNTVLGRAY